MNSFELSRVASEVQRLAEFLRRLGVHPNLWQQQLQDIEMHAVQKIIANNRQMVIDFSANGSEAMAERWGCSRRTAFRWRDKASKECHLEPPA